MTERRLRGYAADSTQKILLSYDNLNRPTLKNLPGSEPDVTYGYDNLGRLTSASQTGNALSFTYDALGRNLTQVGPQGTVASQWDIAGRRTRLTYPGAGLYVDYDYLVTGEMTKIRENGATSGVGVLATFAYDNLGRRSSLTRGNGTVTGYGYDPVSRLATLTDDFASTPNDQSVTFSYNPASQIASLTKTNDAYAWTGHGNGSTASVANGLNQLSSIGGTATAHDARGNVTSDPMSGKSYGYSSENLLTSSSGGTSATLGYDPAMRLYELAAGATTRFQYDGVNLIAEYDGSNALQRRYVFGPAVDEPLVHYEGTDTSNRSWLHADERGSVIALSDGTGAVTTINKYDEYGKPQATNIGRFQYTGQVWLAVIGAYYYKARIYSPGYGGTFLQTDPIGTEGGINLYAYVGNDPVNWTDPLGLKAPTPPPITCPPDVNQCVPGTRPDGPTAPQGSGWSAVSNIVGVGGWSLSEMAKDLGQELCVDGSAGCDVRVVGRLIPRVTGNVLTLILRPWRAALISFCAIPSYELGTEAAFYRGYGVRASGALAYNTRTGGLFAKGSVGGGLGYGQSGAIGPSAQSSETGAGTRSTLDSRIAGGAGFFGADATYNWLTIENGKNIGSQGLSGSIGAAKAYLPGSAYFALIESNRSLAIELDTIGTPCD